MCVATTRPRLCLVLVFSCIFPLVSGCSGKGEITDTGHFVSSSAPRDASWEPVTFHRSATFRVYARRGETGKIELQFDGAPSFVHPLEMSPEHREPVFDHGRWLILVYAVWSRPDIESIPTAVEGVRKLGLDIQLGIRPFADYNEMYKWYPEYDGSAESPYWMYVKDGTLLEVRNGRMSEDELATFIKTADAQ